METQRDGRTLVVSFRGKKVDIPLVAGVTVRDVRSNVASSADASLQLEASHVKLLHKGKVLEDDQLDMYELLVEHGKKKTVYRIMATGVSHEEARATNQEFEEGLRNAPRIRDDLTSSGRQELARRQQLGRKMMQQAARRDGGKVSSETFGFGRIETLPMLPEENKAREILNTLANDPGILACMEKHQWNVGSLAEMYPEGKVGESEVCVMGLNRNKGQQILLRVRTDDLKGFRKMLSIRKVLFHELAHNVHSEHNQDFFQLMRQIERECNDMNWTKSSGHMTGGVGSTKSYGMEEFGNTYAFSGGTFRLGGEGNESTAQSNMSKRELAARAAMLRMTAEEEEIQNHCGCGKDIPISVTDSKTDETLSRTATMLEDMQDNENNLSDVES